MLSMVSEWRALRSWIARVRAGCADACELLERIDEFGIGGGRLRGGADLIAGSISEDEEGAVEGLVDVRLASEALHVRLVDTHERREHANSPSPKNTASVSRLPTFGVNARTPERSVMTPLSRLRARFETVNA